MDASTATGWPAWVPEGARRYLSHTENGRPIRALAREAQIHASTVLRQVRRYETMRDDPLVDAALRELARSRAKMMPSKTKDAAMSPTRNEADGPSAEKITAESARVLRRMAEPGAVLAIASGMELGVVVREEAGGAPQRTASVDRRVAQVMALRDLIACDDPEARICRYHITAQGRAELRKIMAQDENGAQGFAEGQARFEGASPVRRAAPADSPLAGLARRRDKDGQPFLDRDLVQVGERLREDFELAQMEPNVTQDWNKFLTAGVSGGAAGAGGGPADARARVEAALADLGPGLGDVVLRCCCYLEGMETTEKRLGWSARSGKIVLRIALQRLKRHYDEQGQYGPMIG